MAQRRINPNAIKLYWTYDVSELAACCGVHKNTVRQWRGEGLTPIDERKPILFLGATVREFLILRNAKRKQPCGPGKLYCLRCRQPRPPALEMAEYIPITQSSGNVRAICGTCETMMHRRAALSAIAIIMPGIEVQFAERQLRLIGSPSPSLNCDLEKKAAA
jgi:hypothetical protein